MLAVHPGRVLKRELSHRNLTANGLAMSLRLPASRIAEILHGRRSVTPETALRLGRFFGNSARFWLNLQIGYDLARAEDELGQRVANEVRPLEGAADGQP
jgi:antitoxin HigA-1